MFQVFMALKLLDSWIHSLPLHTHTHTHTASSSASFSGDNYIQYQVTNPTSSSSMARSSRQAGGLYTKGQTLISLSFRTTQSHGTLLLLGDFGGNSEYAVLEVSVRLLYSFSLIPKLDWNV